MSASAQTSTPLLRQSLDDGIDQMGIVLDSVNRDRLIQFVTLLAKWNRTYNLTAVREPERMISQHILDSLSVLPHLGGCSSILDVGTGAGLPGLPLAVASPSVQFTLLDTVAKKTAFVRQAIGELGLKNITVVTGSVENYKTTKNFSRVISRAFAELKDFVDGAGQHCAAGGALLAMKGVYPHDEISRLPAGYIAEEVISLDVPGVEGQRHLVVIKKD